MTRRVCRARFLAAFYSGRTMRALGNHLGARTICLALIAGLVAFEAVLMLDAGAVGIPGVLLVRFTDGSGGSLATQKSKAAEGGESVIAKLQITTEEPPKREALSDTAASRTPAPLSSGEPQLAGLAEIPLRPWDRPDPKPDEPKALAANASSQEVLPWDAVEPFPLPDRASRSEASAATAALLAAPPETPHVPAAPMRLPSRSAVESWVKAKATEIKGEDRGRALYHFEYWLDAPEDVKRRLVAVAYDFNTPAVMPQSQVSSEEKTGFLIRAGGLTCADKITVTLRFNDGQSQQVAVDGCRLLG